MSTEIAENNAGTAMAIPSHLAAAFGAVETNINVGEATPHLSIKGKTWKMVVEGNENVLMTKDADGEPTPVSKLKVIILNQVPKRSRTYFEGDYVEGSNTAPACWSVDGETPDHQVSEPQAKSCSNCPQAVKGSKINNNGDAIAACSSSKRICVIPSGKPEFTALLLKLPVTSLWEKEESEKTQGWYAYDSYLKFLKANNVSHTGMVETMMKFDSKDVAYPKVLFKYNGFISEDFAAVIAGRINSDEVLDVLGIGEASKAVTLEHIPEASSESNVAPVEEVDNSAAEAVAEKAAAQAAKEAKAAKALKAKEAKAAKAAKAKAEKEAKVAEEAANVVTVDDDEGLSDVMDDWD